MQKLKNNTKMMEEPKEQEDSSSNSLEGELGGFNFTKIWLNFVGTLHATKSGYGKKKHKKQNASKDTKHIEPQHNEMHIRKSRMANKGKNTRARNSNNLENTQGIDVWTSVLSAFQDAHSRMQKSKRNCEPQTRELKKKRTICTRIRRYT